MIFMKNMPTNPISSFRRPGNNCTRWNNSWNHSSCWNPCWNHNCCCKEDVRQVLVSKLLIRLFKQQHPLSEVTGIPSEMSNTSSLPKVTPATRAANAVSASNPFSDSGNTVRHCGHSALILITCMAFGSAYRYEG